MRFRISALSFIILIGLVAVEPAPAGASDDVVFEGSGWGHGMGLSQWGAYERARQGQSAEDIVTAYYPTASLVKTSDATSQAWFHSDPEPVWVNMLGTSPYSNRTSFKLRASASGLTICQQEPRTETVWSLNRNAGEYSEYVEILEHALQDAGFDPGDIDGFFDEETDAAVRAFQADRGLGVDGAVGKNTKAALWPADSGDRCVIETPLPTSTITVTQDGDGNCVVPGAVAVGDCIGSVRGLSESKRVVLPEKTDGGVAVQLAHGDLRIRPDIDSGTGAIEGVHVILEVGLEDYTAGIDEVMLWWDSSGAGSALEAQAIAARTYGLRLVLSYGELGQLNGSAWPYTDSQLSSAQRDNCWCHLYANTYSQVYNGWTRETEGGGTWVDAVEATVDPSTGEGLVLTAPGHGVIWAFYTSSNGGASESHDAYNGYSPPSNFSYLVSVDDPYSLTDDNPYSSWDYSFSPAYVASKLGFSELVGVDVVATNQSGSAKTVEFHGMVSGELVVVEKTGAWVASTFGLRSRYFDVTWGDTSGDPNPVSDPDYTDIADSIFRIDIEWAQSQGIAFACNPPSNDEFCPENAVTREEMAVFMVNALDLPPASKDHFTDDENSPYEDAINRMADAGITTGCGGTKFCPDLTVDRGQMAAFLGRAFGLRDNGGGDLFIDDDDSIFENDIDRLGTAGITKGCNPPANTKFCPYNAVDRGAMMAFLHRALGG